MEEDIYEWRKIPGFGYRYEVSERGEVRSWAQRGRGCMPAEEPMLLKAKERFGMPSVVLVREGGKRVCRTISSLMRDVGFIQVESHLAKIMRPVVKVDKEGKLISEYPSVREAARAHSVCDSTIWYYLKEHNKKWFDLHYTFRYADEFYKQEELTNGSENGQGLPLY